MKNATIWFFKHYKTAALLCGLAAAFVFAPFYQIWLLPLAFGLSFALLDKAPTWRAAVGEGYWFGFGFFAAGFYWIGNALLIDAETFGWLYPITLFGAGAFFGLFTILPFMTYFFARAKLWTRLLSFASAWVLLEWIRSFILTGFPWNLLGTALAFEPAFIQTAALWGTYGLSFILLLWAGLFYVAVGKKRFLPLVFFVLLPLLFYAVGAWRIQAYDAALSDIKVRLVQPSIAQQMKWNRDALEQNLETYLEMSRTGGLDDVDFVVWGETAVPFDLDDEARQKQISAAVPARGYLLTGALRRDAYGRFYNSLFAINSEGKPVAFYDKSHLVPFGEYIPFRQYLPHWVHPVAAQIADFGHGDAYKIINISEYPAFGALICYEIIFPDAVLDRAHKPQWLVLISNDGWYGDSAGPYQHLVAAQMRAVEEGITIVRSANNGISALINPLGQIEKRIEYNTQAVLDVYLPKKMVLFTYYNIYSQVLFYLVILVMALILGMKKKNHVNLRKK